MKNRLVPSVKTIRSSSVRKGQMEGKCCVENVRQMILSNCDSRLQCWQFREFNLKKQEFLLVPQDAEPHRGKECVKKRWAKWVNEEWKSSVL